MISQYRKIFNEQFSEEKYEAFLKDLYTEHNHTTPFRISETPAFIPKQLKKQLLEACDEIMEVINQPNFKELTQGAFLKPELMVPNEDDAPKFLQFDFGICLDENGQPIPKLIELQGFPSMYFFQELLERKYREHYEIPQNFTMHPDDLSTSEFLALLREEIVGDTDPKQVILLELTPHLQATAIDFYATVAHTGIKLLCISELKKRGKSLFYLDDDGHEVKVLKIYNRIIFDELYQRDDIQREFNFTDEVDIEWIGHPNWFFRISKYTMPFLKSKYVPNSYHLDKLETLPSDLENYVLKPLYSFAGAGIQLHVTPEMIEALPDKSNYLLQRKVAYHPIIETMDVPSKCEVRMMLLHCKKTNETKVISNLMRLSKGEMIGVKYNKDRSWVGASVGLFED
jgi:hypothetical protein